MDSSLRATRELIGHNFILFHKVVWMLINLGTWLFLNENEIVFYIFIYGVNLVDSITRLMEEEGKTQRKYKENEVIPIASARSHGCSLVELVKLEGQKN